MKHKIFILLFIAIICACIIFITIGCSHECSFSEWKEVKAETCTETGLSERTCICGKKEEKIIEINADNHNFSDWTITKEATCTESGLKTRNCACGKTEQLPIEINPENHLFEQISTQETTHCSGIKLHNHCKLCEKNFDITTNKEILNKDDIFVPAIHSDSYDMETFYCSACDKYVIINALQLGKFRDNVNNGNNYIGKTVTLGADIDLDNIEWAPINLFAGIFDGENHTIYNLKISSGDRVGLFGDQWQINTEIKNFTLDGVNINGGEYVGGVLARTASTKLINVHVKNANIKATHYAGGVLGYGYTSILGCSAENVTILCVPNPITNGFDNGDKVGGIVGCMFSGKIEDCSANNITLTGYRDIGGIVGMISNGDGPVSAKNNIAANINICVDQVTNHYGTKDTNAGGVIGRNIGAVTENNTESEINIQYKLNNPA